MVSFIDCLSEHNNICGISLIKSDIFEIGWLHLVLSTLILSINGLTKVKTFSTLILKDDFLIKNRKLIFLFIRSWHYINQNHSLSSPDVCEVLLALSLYAVLQTEACFYLCKG